MQATLRSGAWGHAARLGVLSAGLGLMAGCATGYAVVQPDAAGSGAYYPSDGPYSGQGSLYYGTGPYYPGTSGYGYYSGADPYSGPLGGYGYWPSVTLDLGISNGWDFPGYWGPWYSTGFPLRRCWHRGCGHRWQEHHHHHWHDAVATTSPRPWLKPDHSLVPPLRARGPERPVQMSERPVERFANRRPLSSTEFAPHEFAREPVNRLSGADFAGMPMPPRIPEFANPRVTPTARQDFQTAPRPAPFRQAPAVQPAPSARPATPRSDMPRTKIP